MERCARLAERSGSSETPAAIHDVDSLRPRVLGCLVNPFTSRLPRLFFPHRRRGKVGALYETAAASSRSPAEPCPARAERSSLRRAARLSHAAARSHYNRARARRHRRSAGTISRRISTPTQAYGERRFVGLFTSSPTGKPSRDSLFAPEGFAGALAIGATAGRPGQGDGACSEHVPRDECSIFRRSAAADSRPAISASGDGSVFLPSTSSTSSSPRSYSFPPTAQRAVRERIPACGQGVRRTQSASMPMLDAIAGAHPLLSTHECPRRISTSRRSNRVRVAIAREDGPEARASHASSRTSWSPLWSAFPSLSRVDHAERGRRDIGRIDGRAEGRRLAGDIAAHFMDGRRRRHRCAEAVRAGSVVPLSACLPVFENLGLK